MQETEEANDSSSSAAEGKNKSSKLKGTVQQYPTLFSYGSS